jgi:hypothetical protein
MNAEQKPTDDMSRAGDGGGDRNNGDDGNGAPAATGGTGGTKRTLGGIDDALAFDLLENPQSWPDDPKLQGELAELLEMHLVMCAHADDAESALSPVKGFRRFASTWLLPTAAALVAVLPATYAVVHVRETRRMQARGAALEVQIQKRVSAELWSDFFGDTLELLKQVQSPAKYCAPSREDRSGEVEQARRLYAMGSSLSMDGLDDPEALDAKKILQNWLTEVSANDACMTVERSHELLGLAIEMDLEGKANRLNRRLKGVYS